VFSRKKVCFTLAHALENWRNLNCFFQFLKAGTIAVAKRFSKEAKRLLKAFSQANALTGSYPQAKKGF